MLTCMRLWPDMISQVCMAALTVFIFSALTSAFSADIGRYAAQKGVELLLCVGEMSKSTCRAADGIAALHFDNNAQLISQLPQLINKGDTVLVKASHSMKLEEISEALKLLK